MALAAYLAALHDAGRASSSAALAVAAAYFRAKLAEQPTPAGERTARVLAGYRRTAGDRGRGQARPFSAADLAAVLATCPRPRRRGRGGESDEVAAARGRTDAVIAGLLFMGGMRRSEVAALQWADVADAGDADGILVTIRRSKTNQEGETNDVRFVKNGVARAIRTLRAVTSPAPADRVVPFSPQMIGLRFTAAAQAAGLERRVTAHSGRVGLASELTSRGASTTENRGWWSLVLRSVIREGAKWHLYTVGRKRSCHANPDACRPERCGVRGSPRRDCTLHARQFCRRDRGVQRPGARFRLPARTNEQSRLRSACCATSGCFEWTGRRDGARRRAGG